MSKPNSGAVTGYHAHIYYDAGTKPAAADLRTEVEKRFSVALGRWHDQTVGPHPTGSYQITFEPEMFGELIPWLALNRNGLVVFVHPNTGDDLADHAARAIWLGQTQPLDLSKL